MYASIPIWTRLGLPSSALGEIHGMKWFGQCILLEYGWLPVGFGKSAAFEEVLCFIVSSIMNLEEGVFRRDI